MLIMTVLSTFLTLFIFLKGNDLTIEKCSQQFSNCYTSSKNSWKQKERCYLMIETVGQIAFLKDFVLIWTIWTWNFSKKNQLLPMLFNHIHVIQIKLSLSLFILAMTEYCDPQINLELFKWQFQNYNLTHFQTMLKLQL